MMITIVIFLVIIHLFCVTNGAHLWAWDAPSSLYKYLQTYITYIGLSSFIVVSLRNVFSIIFHIMCFLAHLNCNILLWRYVLNDDNLLWRSQWPRGVLARLGTGIVGSNLDQVMDVRTLLLCCAVLCR